MEKFKSQGGTSVKEFCPYGTRDECRRNNSDKERCSKVGKRVNQCLFSVVLCWFCVELKASVPTCVLRIFPNYLALFLESIPLSYW